MVVHDLAKLCDLDVPEAKLEDFSKVGSTFLVKRFDRAKQNQRIHFVSAMTLLGKRDGAGASDGSSYLDIASIIRQSSAAPKKDSLELWRRIVFNMALSIAKLFDLKESQATTLLYDIKMIVEDNWSKTAKQYGLSRGEIENMSPAFDMRYK